MSVKLLKHGLFSHGRMIIKMGNKKVYDVIIIGAGAAGLFFAKTLKTDKFLILEKGAPLQRRKCFGKNKCKNCKVCSIVYGVGGAGLFSDGKLNFSMEIGGKPSKVFSKKNYQKIQKEFINEFKFRISKIKEKQINDFNKKYGKTQKCKFIGVPQTHIGSDKLPALINSLMNRFADSIICPVEVKKVSKGEYFCVQTSRGSFFSRNVIVATGQAGSGFAASIAKKAGIKVKPSCVDLGIRVECDSKIVKPLINLQYDPKIRFSTSKGIVRTFCTNPNGFVLAERKHGFISVNGHSMKERKSACTNFALMHSFSCKDPLRFIIKTCTRITKENKSKVILQKADDFVNDISTNKLDKTVTYQDYVLESLSKYYPKGTLIALRQALISLDKIIPSFLKRSVVYAPEVKLYNSCIKVSKDSFEAEIKGLFFLGDCCGHIHGLLNAIYSGISCAKQINRRKR